jgi:hypothetical protein
MNKQDEKRVREIAREEIEKYMQKRVEYLSFSVVPPKQKKY